MVQDSIQREGCVTCIMNFNSFSRKMDGENVAVGEALLQDSAMRLKGTFDRGWQEMQNEDVGEHVGVSHEVTLALLEVLIYWQVLVADTGPFRSFCHQGLGLA